MPVRYISISGNIGTGKSSMVEFLSRTFKLKHFFEPNEDNPYLADFYADMKRWAFHSQMHFLSSKFRIHQELERVETAVIQDRTIFEDAEIFATHLFNQGFIDKRDFATYQELYKTILRSLKAPDLMIYLECPLTTIRKRIKERGRAMEQNMPMEYLRKLNDLYENWIARYNLSPVLRISTEKLDYMSDFLYRDDLITKIEHYVHQT